jgi:hypothetical protein
MAELSNCPQGCPLTGLGIASAQPLGQGEPLGIPVDTAACRPSRHLYIEPLSLGLPKRLPVPEVANHLVCSVCGARNDELKRPIHARPDARVQGVTGKYPRW